MSLAEDAPALVAPDGAIDGLELRRRLTALSREHDGAPLRAAARELLAEALAASRSGIMEDFREWRMDGLEAARRIGEETDELVRALYDFITVHVFRSRNPTEGERFAIAAVGGYGRGELAPFSDLDLLFLRGWKQTAWEESVIEYMLYMLWDLGLKVGHAARSIDDCARRARGDQQILTNMLDARLLAGDETVFGSFQEMLYLEAIHGRERDYVAAKLAERDARHARTGATRYMVEPDIKDGKGGLRDLQTLGWIAKALFPGQGLAALPGEGLFTRDDAAQYAEAERFYWSVRLHLHDVARRPQETLSFDFQPEIAARMRYLDVLHDQAVERFMRDYFRVATDVGGLVRVACARLEAIHAKPATLSLSRLIDFARNARTDNPAFAFSGARLTLASPETLAEDPVLMLELFAEAAKLDVDVDPEALAHIRARHELIEGPAQSDPRAREALFTVFDSPAPERALRLMIEAGVLGAFIPEFGRIVGRTQFNMYHAYTVDEHTLRAIGVLARIRSGALAEEHPLTTAAIGELKHPRLLFLAMLLHDTGKTGGDQCVNGAKAARAVCERFALPEEQIALVEWLILHHLDMSDAAQTRDIGNPKTISDFAELVGDMDRLRMLACLTTADVKAVAPGLWTGFKAQLLRELYQLTVAALDAEENAAMEAANEGLAQRAESIRAEVRARAGDDPELVRWTGELDDSYWLALDPEEIISHARFVADARRQGLTEAVRARDNPRRAAAELAVYAPDRLGLFADLSRAIAYQGAEVIDARIATTEAGVAFDIFDLQTPTGEPYGAGAPGALTLLEEAVLAAARGAAPRRSGDQGARMREAVFEIDPEVTLDDEASESHTVVEASGRNRPGLMSELAHIIAEAGFSVASAHIATRGERVVDVFYIHEPGGGALTDRTAREALVDAMLEVLAAGEEAAEKVLEKRGVRRARSTVER